VNAGAGLPSTTAMIASSSAEVAPNLPQARAAGRNDPGRGSRLDPELPISMPSLFLRALFPRRHFFTLT